jgi:hypothetical protein
VLIAEFLDGHRMPLFDADQEDLMNQIYENELKIESAKRRTRGQSEVIKVRFLRDSEKLNITPLETAA